MSSEPRSRATSSRATGPRAPRVTTRRAPTLARLLVVTAGAFLSIASASNRPTDRPDPRPRATTFFCTTEWSQASAASICRPTYDGCERERAEAGAQGLGSTDCVATSPVACFPLAGGPPADPAGGEWCAATLEDCERWRQVDESRGGPPAPACAWKE